VNGRFPITVRWEETDAAPLEFGDSRVVPRARALTIEAPQAVFVWNRPTAVILSRDDRTQRIAIPDLTRLLQLGILGSAAAVCLASLLAGKHHEGGAKWKRRTRR
jgi:hypothetical protein